MQLSEQSATVSAFLIERESNEKLLGRFSCSNKQLLAELEQERDITHSLRTMVASLQAADTIAVDKLKSAWAIQRDMTDRWGYSTFQQSYGQPKFHITSIHTYMLLNSVSKSRVCKYMHVYQKQHMHTNSTYI